MPLCIPVIWLESGRINMYSASWFSLCKHHSKFSLQIDIKIWVSEISLLRLSNVLCFPSESLILESIIKKLLHEKFDLHVWHDDKWLDTAEDEVPSTFKAAVTMPGQSNNDQKTLRFNIVELSHSLLGRDGILKLNTDITSLINTISADASSHPSMLCLIHCSRIRNYKMHVRNFVQIIQTYSIQN